MTPSLSDWGCAIGTEHTQLGRSEWVSERWETTSLKWSVWGTRYPIRRLWAGRKGHRRWPMIRLTWRGKFSEAELVDLSSNQTVAAILGVTVVLVEILKAMVSKLLPSYHEREIIKTLDSITSVQARTLEILVRLEERTNGDFKV